MLVECGLFSSSEQEGACKSLHSRGASPTDIVDEYQHRISPLTNCGDESATTPSPFLLSVHLSSHVLQGDDATKHRLRYGQTS